MSAADNGQFFAISRRDFEAHCRAYPKTTSLSLGALMVPVKLRMATAGAGSFDFSRDVAIGTSVGIRQGLSRFKPYYFNGLIGTGVSTVAALPQNTGGFASTPADLSAFTVSLGAILDLDGVQLGLFSGIDMVTREAGQHWIYQQKPWFSLGIGYQFLNWNAPLSQRGTN